MSHSRSLATGNDNFEVVGNFRYLSDEFDSKRSYSVLCKTRAQKSISTTTVQRGQVWERTDPKYDTPVLRCVPAQANLKCGSLVQFD